MRRDADGDNFLEQPYIRWLPPIIAVPTIIVVFAVLGIAKLLLPSALTRRWRL